ncbi:MAG: dephospho-CoA kinase [Coprobacillaceae bacterium]
MTLVVGITGGIATGKSTVTNYLIKHNYVVLDSDLFSREALTIDKGCIELVKQNFDCVTNGEIDRKKLGSIVFHDKKAKKKLEDIVHPYVIKRLKNGIVENKDREIVFLDIPLLYECHLEYLCDTIVVVYCDEESQILRLMHRDNIDREYAKTIINNQMSMSEKLKQADIVLDNSKSKEDLLEQIQKLW